MLIFIFIRFYFLLPLRFLLWPMDNSEVCLISKGLKFPLDILLLIAGQISFWSEKIFYSIIFSLMKFLLWPRIHLNDPQALGKKSVLSCCWIECVYLFKLVLFVDYVVQIFYVLDDFLSSSAIIWWEGSVEVLHYNWEFFHFFFEPY